MLKKLTVCLDMAGCPNRCRHCWVGTAPNGQMSVEDMIVVSMGFRLRAHRLELASWYREPDFSDNYKELWLLEREVSNFSFTPHFELCSFWRAARDSEYAPWLAAQGLKACQLTLFGGREKTDYYCGRKGAYDEIIKTMDALLKNGIAPRIQTFLFKDNADDLQAVEALIIEKQLIERCEKIGTPFSAFVHSGSCDGANARRGGLYELRPTAEDVEKIPPLLSEYTLKHFGKERLMDVFGKTEREWCEILADDESRESFVSDAPVFYVDGEFNVYPNLSEPSPDWCLGNFKTDGARRIVENYVNNSSKAQAARVNVPLGEMVRTCGDLSSERLFEREDFEMYLLDRYLQI